MEPVEVKVANISETKPIQENSSKLASAKIWLKFQYDLA